MLVEISNHINILMWNVLNISFRITVSKSACIWYVCTETFSICNVLLNSLLAILSAFLPRPERCVHLLHDETVRPRTINVDIRRILVTNETSYHKALWNYTTISIIYMHTSVDDCAYRNKTRQWIRYVLCRALCNSIYVSCPFKICCWPVVACVWPILLLSIILT